MDKKTATQKPKSDKKRKAGPKSQPETSLVEAAQPVAEPQEPAPTAPEPPAMSLIALTAELMALKDAVTAQGQQIADLMGKMARRRSLAHNGKVQIKDKETGTIYPSKNNAYQSMLKAGELQELVDKGIFGPEPAKNNFGWFALVRAWPDRFEEVKPEDK